MRFLCFEVRLYGLVRESDKFFLVPLLVNGTRKSFIDWDAIKEHHDLAMNPRHPHVQGTSQGPDIFFQCVEAGNTFYDGLADLFEEKGKLLGVFFCGFCLVARSLEVA